MDLSHYGIVMWEPEKIAAFRAKLLAWYDQHHRPLPWRQTRDPYAIWVSEIMSQQTRVDTVIPYYHRFLQALPSLQDLAQASQEDLLYLWQGLGYYSRVRNMQVAAQTIMTDYGGHFPKDLEAIRSLKGIGPYTAGAIASISFGIPEPAVDGNVMRVLARLFEVDLDIGQAKNWKVFHAMAKELIDPERPGDFNQALMDLGADIESPFSPRPQDSPVKEFSAAYLHGTMDRYPIKAPKKKPVVMHWDAFVVLNGQGQVFLEKNTYADLLSGFWHFPLLRNYQEGVLVSEGRKPQEIPNYGLSNQEIFQQTYGLPVSYDRTLEGVVTHTFSHQKWRVTLHIYELDQRTLPIGVGESEETTWARKEDWDQLPLSSLQRKLFHALEKEGESRKS